MNTLLQLEAPHQSDQDGGRTESEKHYKTNQGFIGKGFWIRVLNPVPISQYKEYTILMPKLVGDQFILKCFSNSVGLCLFES